MRSSHAWPPCRRVRKAHATDSLAQRAWALWMMQSMGLPTGNMSDGLIQTLAQAQSSQPGTPTGGSAPGFGPFASGTGPDTMALVVARVGDAPAYRALRYGGVCGSLGLAMSMTQGIAPAQQ